MAPDVIHMTGRRRPIEEVGLAVREFGRSLASYRLWGALALHDVLGRYRGSLLGPLWITLATSSLIVGMGLVVMLIVLAVLLPIIQLNQWVR